MLSIRSTLSRPARPIIAGMLAAAPLQGLVAGAALCAIMLGASSAAAQATPGTVLPERNTAGNSAGTAAGTAAGSPERVVAATDIDLVEAPLVAGMLQDEALHRNRLGRIHRLRALAAQGNQRERLMQIDELERREIRRHEARVVRDRSMLSERSARGVEELVARGGTWRARGDDIAAARKRRIGLSGDDVLRRGAEADRGPDRSATRTTRPAGTRSPTRSPSGNSGSRGGSGGGGGGPR